MAGGEQARPDEGRGVGQDLEAHPAVAAHAGVRRPAGPVPRHEVLDHAPAERLGGVDREVREAERVGARAGEPDGLGRAARALRGGRAGVVPEAHRHPDHVVARVAQEHCRHRAVDAAAHRDRHPVGLERDAGVPQPSGVPALEGPGDRVGHELGPVPAVGVEAAEVGVERLRREGQRVVEGGSPQPRAGRARRGRGRAAAEREEARVPDAAVAEPQRDAHEIAARGAPRLAQGVRGLHPARAHGSGQMAHRLSGVGRHRGRLPPRPR
jgi:hypothetical protein